MQFKGLLLSGSIVRNLYRTYVSTVSVNVNSFVSVRVQTKDSSDSSEEVKLTLLDGQKTKVDATKVKSLTIVSNNETFKLDCDTANELSALIELPVTSQDVQIEVTADKLTEVHLEHLQAKSVEVEVKVGDISTNNLKCELMKAVTGRGNITSKSLLLGKEIHLVSRNGVS